jgi:hypothetical protein
VAANLRNTGQLDLVVRKAGGGPLTIYENQLPPRNYLEVSLRGRQSNRLGIGARIVVETGKQKMTREMYPINSYFSQAPARAHFGLADAAKIDRLTILWPSGQVQTLSDVAANRHIAVEEGKTGSEAIQTVIPGKTIAP